MCLSDGLGYWCPLLASERGLTEAWFEFKSLLRPPVQLSNGCEVGSVPGAVRDEFALIFCTSFFYSCCCCFLFSAMPGLLVLLFFFFSFLFVFFFGLYLSFLIFVSIRYSDLFSLSFHVCENVFHGFALKVVIILHPQSKEKLL